MSVEHIQPQGLPKPPTYSHVVKAGNTVYVAGQVAQDEKGQPVGRGDFTAQATQVFENLLSNGLKFQTETPARVEVSARDVGGEWLFSVRDYGIGVEPEFTDSIFDLFKRLQQEYSGTGVGLAICRRIVERHGGRIWVESRAGEGSTFNFTLSKKPARARSMRPVAALRSPRRAVL